MSSYVKYPRTPHLPWSPGVSSDDVRTHDLSSFTGQRVVVTEKLDGENTSMYRDHIHARSIDSKHHPSRDWVKGFHATIAHEIPEGWRLCGENLYARHSIAYDHLRSYFYLFSVWDADNRCLSWPETEEWAELLGLPTPRVLFEGPFDAVAIERIKVDETESEGYVVRLAAGFGYTDFATSVAKWVRPNHVQSDGHWMHQAVVPNGLVGDSKNDDQEA